MTQYRTNNPLGSMAPRDLYDNAQNIDNWSNGEEPFYEDRFGKLRRSFSGMNFEFEAAQDGRDVAFDTSLTDKETRFQAFLVSSGYVSKGDYAAGVVLAERNEYVAVDAATTGTSPGMYRPNASATLPLTLTGTWETDAANLVLLGDDVLRQELASSGGAAMIGSGVVAVESVAELLALPEGQRRGDLRYLVKGGTPLTDNVGGEFYFDGESFNRVRTDLITPSQLSQNITQITSDDLGVRRNLILFGSATYDADVFHRQDNSTVIGNGATVRVGGGDPVRVRIGNNATIDGVQFQSTELDVDNSRGTMELTDGAKYSNCVFRGFRSPSTMNGWGLYLQVTKNATITNVKFSNNTTYDLTLVDAVENTTISGVNSEDGNGCIMVIEPNAIGPGGEVTNTRIFGSKFSYFGIMENSTPSTYVYGTTIDGCQIDELLLQGGVRTRLLNSTFNTITSSIGQSSGMMCELESDSIWLGSELLADPSLSTVGLVGSPWTFSSPQGRMFSRTGDSIRIWGEDEAGVAYSAGFAHDPIILPAGTYCLKADVTASLDNRNATINAFVYIAIDGVPRYYHPKLFGDGEKGVRSGVRTLFFTLTQESSVSVGTFKDTGYFTNIDIRGVSLRKLEDHGLPFNEVPLLFNAGDYAFATLPTLSSAALWRERDMDGTRFGSLDAEVDSYVIRGDVPREVRFYSPPTP